MTLSLDDYRVAQIARASSWGFVGNHLLVLLAIHRDPNATTRHIAAWAGISQRAVQTIVRDLEADGYLTGTRDGRRNHYTIDTDRPIRDPALRDRDVTVAQLLELLTKPLPASA